MKREYLKHALLLIFIMFIPAITVCIVWIVTFFHFDITSVYTSHGYAICAGAWCLVVIPIYTSVISEN